VEDDEDDLVMAGLGAADLLVARVRREAAGIADRRRVDAGQLPELALGAPEAAEPEHRPLEPLGERRLEPRAIDEMLRRHRHLARAAGQRVLAARHFELLLRCEPHDSLRARSALNLGTRGGAVQGGAARSPVAAT